MRSRTASGSFAAMTAWAMLLTWAAPASSQASIPGSARERFVGNWELVSFISYDSAGTPRDNGYTGRILYDALGNMSAVGMPRSLPERARAAAGTQTTGGFAYFGTFDVDEAQGRVVHHVHGSPINPSWVNTDLVRYYAFSGDTLSLSIRNAQGRVTGTLTWKRFR